MSKPKKPFLPVDPSKNVLFSLAADLTDDHYTGIGKVIHAHAILENQVSELVFELMRIDHPEGRVAFKYRAASTQFDLAINLIHLRGIQPLTNLFDLKDQIRGCCTVRDQLAHCVWIEGKGTVALRLTDGHYETPEGKRSRSILPEPVYVHDTYYDEQRTVTMDTAIAVQSLRREIMIALGS